MLSAMERTFLRFIVGAASIAAGAFLLFAPAAPADTSSVPASASQQTTEKSLPQRLQTSPARVVYRLTRGFHS